MENKTKYLLTTITVQGLWKQSANGNGNAVKVDSAAESQSWTAKDNNNLNPQKRDSKFYCA